MSDINEKMNNLIDENNELKKQIEVLNGTVAIRDRMLKRLGEKHESALANVIELTEQLDVLTAQLSES